MITFAYDMATHKVGCVLLQAAYGCTIDNFNLQKFGLDNWVLAPTPTLKVFRVKDQEELEMAIEVCKRKNNENKNTKEEEICS